jgi:hypothetical protein
MTDSTWRRDPSSNRLQRYKRRPRSTFTNDTDTSLLRSVYIVARPITKAKEWGIDSLSEDSFPFCHWGLLISPFDESGLQRHLSREARKGCNSDLSQWGTLLELFNQAGRCTVNVVEDFGVLPALEEWDYVLIRCVGRTEMSNDEIREHAYEIIQTRPDYHGYSNNCQNFVRYLHLSISTATETSIFTPLTIQETLQNWYKISQFSNTSSQTFRIDIQVVTGRQAFRYKVRLRSIEGLRFKAMFVGAIFFFF